jgi:putative spermidine/putrescine transport system permease protein
MSNQAPQSASELVWRWIYRGICACVFGFLILPILAIIPLSFNDSSYLTYPLQSVSLRWYHDLMGDRWMQPVRNSFSVAIATTLLATTLGTVGALGLTQLTPRWRGVMTAFLISPLIVPVIITAVGIYFLFSPLGLTNSFLGLVLAHTTVAVPFVLITVTATLQGFDTRLSRAAASLGASPFTVFRRVILPLILPGVITGAVLAFIASFDEIVISLFLAGPAQRTLPLQMFSGIREEISPTITAAATLLVVLSTILLAVVELLRRRSANYAGRKN